MAEVVLASRNTKKLAELQVLLDGVGFRLRPVTDFGGEAPDENAPSFVENALLKARAAARLARLPAIADDSGLEVEALDGAPGVASAVYAGRHGDDEANNAKLLAALRDVPETRRGARFVSVLVFLRHAEDPTPVIAYGFWSGRILTAPRGSAGFGYDPLFWVSEHGKSSAELAPALKNRISHRARAAAQLLRALRG